MKGEKTMGYFDNATSIIGRTDRHHAMLKLQATVLRDCTIRIADGVCCPACGTAIRTSDPEETNDGWRIVCSSCHRDLLVVEEDR
jgi:hypothetical protein